MSSSCPLTIDDRSTIFPRMPRQTDAKERLLDSALELVYARSYADVGVEDICRRARVKKGSFYYFFRSKQELVREAFENFFRSQAAKMLDQAFADDVPPLDRIRRFFGLLYQFQKKRKESTGRMCGCHFGNLAVEVSTQDEAMRLAVSRLLDGISRRIESALRDAERAGQVRHIDIQRSAQSILAYMEGLLLMAKAKNDPGIIASLQEGAVALLLEPKGTRSQARGGGDDAA